jgi:hypothetical protein
MTRLLNLTPLPGWERARVRGIKERFLENPGFSRDRFTRRLQSDLEGQLFY